MSSFSLSREEKKRKWETPKEELVAGKETGRRVAFNFSSLMRGKEGEKR